MAHEVKRVGIMTAGGVAPCLSSAVGGLIERYSELDPSVEILCYRGGYKGLLLGDRIVVTPAIRAQAALLHDVGGSPIGNSRVKLTNVDDCVRRGLIKPGADPQQVAADQLMKDGVDVLHTVGGDDTNTSAAELAAFLVRNGHPLRVIGLPKTIDNDVFPIRQSLGADTAAEQGALFFDHIVAEGSANPRMLLIHEVMGRHCGWLTAATARAYHALLDRRPELPDIGFSRASRRVHALFIPEAPVDLAAEGERLRRVMDVHDCVNIFVSEGAGVDNIIAEKKARGEILTRDAFGHVKLDAVNAGAWFGQQLAGLLDAGKTLVQKSGYFCRSSPANRADLRLIKSCVDVAVDAAFRGERGVVGHDEERQGVLRAIEFERIAGGKAFDVHTPWYVALLRDMGQVG